MAQEVPLPGPRGLRSGRGCCHPRAGSPGRSDASNCPHSGPPSSGPRKAREGPFVTESKLQSWHGRARSRRYARLVSASAPQSRPRITGLIWTPPSHRPRWYASGRSCSSRPSRCRIGQPKPIMRPEAFEWSRVIAAVPSDHIVSYRRRRAVPCPAGHVRPYLKACSVRAQLGRSDREIADGGRCPSWAG
jgi:hypothetical protein